MVFVTVELLLVTISLLSIIYYYKWLTCYFDFWKIRNVNGPKPIPLLGNVLDLVTFKYSIGCFLRKIYNEYNNEKIVGLFVNRRPALMINDMDLIKSILIKDFSSFMDRGYGTHEKTDPLTMHLFNLEPARWRPLRAKLTPAFTSGKLREMFYLLIECSDQLDNYLNKYNGQIVNMREISFKFTIDVIGTCVFGLQANALNDPDSPFKIMSKKIFDPNWKNLLNFSLRCFTPRYFYDLIGNLLTDYELPNFFINLTKNTIDYRIKNNITKHDFVDQLKMLKEDPSKLGDIEVTDNFLAAQLFVFFIAGHETSASLISNCLLELAMNHKIQEKLRKEINDELEKSNGKITYQGIKNMFYLDKIFKETIRKYPPVTEIMRVSTTAYTFPDTNISIPENTITWIPIFGIHHDPKYYPDPDKFDPERFSDEVIRSRHPMSFLGFGDGPRNCIGARFGKMQTKVGIVKILEKYTVDICDKTDKNFEIDPHGFLLTPVNGVYLKLIKAPIV
ncbi:probable cytochrome P450 6a14 [Aphidius gifuensis]|uniref:probable cytochrome P450 6a14 n=1 Tax=Aphidius gifuensis TaxID=684658 RepID=UPI001CDB6FB9|nr:probable cytochrome P450 6a14 [Aphidius gifuensis]